MNEHCTDPFVHLFPSEVPSESDQEIPPIIIKSEKAKDVPKEKLETVECDISCQQEKDMKGDDRFIDGETWIIRQTMADGYYESSAKIERRDFMKEKFYSTQSWASSIPLTFFNYEKHNLRNRPPVEFDSTKEQAIYIVNSQCAAQGTKRLKYFSAMESHVKIDSYGKCGHNIDVPDGMNIDTMEGRVALMKQYRIVLAFDQTKTKDHIYDIVWEALISGSVPVVVGAENIRDHLPPKSFINGGEFSNWDELAEYVKKVLSDKELWESYQKWRTDEAALTAFETRYEFSRTSPACRMCRWAFARKYGLGWDHTKQQIKPMKVPKDKLCTTADHGLVSKPFSEHWMTVVGQDDKVLEEESDGEQCSALTADGEVDGGSFKASRKVVHHDGVTDIIITDVKRDHVDTDVVLRLKFPGVRNPDGACFYNTHSLVPTTRGPKVSSASIQDDEIKVTVLADWETTVRSTGEGVLEVYVQKRDVGEAEDNSTRRIRVIIEETAKIHDKMTEFFPSSFGKIMTKDFVDPLGVFFADS
jgi:hypothetical protein